MRAPSAKEYNVTTGGYLQRAEELRKLDGLANLFYAAFELRCALERTMVDFLVLITQPDPPEQYIKGGQYKPRVVLGIIRKTDPEFERRLHYTRLVMQASGVTRTNTPFDFDWVCDSHDALNVYLHHQKDPNLTVLVTEWVAGLEQNVDSIRAKLLAMWKSNRGYLESTTFAGDQVYELFKTRMHSDEEIVRMLRLSDLPDSLQSRAL